MNIEKINLISEYLQTPNNIYKEYLYKQILADKTAFELLKPQEEIFNLNSSLTPIEMETSCVETIRPKLQAYQRFTNILHTIQNLAIATIVVAGSILSYNHFTSTNQAQNIKTNNYKLENIHKQIDNKNEIKPKSTINITPINKDLISFVENIKLDAEKVIFSGDITKYKSIDNHNQATLQSLAKAKKALAGSNIDLNDVNEYLNTALLEQHEVKIIDNNNKESKRSKK